MVLNGLHLAILLLKIFNLGSMRSHCYHKFQGDEHEVILNGLNGMVKLKTYKSSQTYSFGGHLLHDFYHRIQGRSKRKCEIKWIEWNCGSNFVYRGFIETLIQY